MFRIRLAVMHLTPKQVVDSEDKSREVRPISYDDDYARQRYGYEPSQLADQLV